MDEKLYKNPYAISNCNRAIISPCFIYAESFVHHRAAKPKRERHGEIKWLGSDINKFCSAVVQFGFCHVLWFLRSRVSFRILLRIEETTWRGETNPTEAGIWSSILLCFWSVLLFNVLWYMWHNFLVFTCLFRPLKLTSMCLMKVPDIW